MGNLLWWRLHDRVVNKSRKKFILYKLQTQWNSDKIITTQAANSNTAGSYDWCMEEKNCWKKEINLSSGTCTNLTKQSVINIWYLCKNICKISAFLNKERFEAHQQQNFSSPILYFSKYPEKYKRSKLQVLELYLNLHDRSVH